MDTAIIVPARLASQRFPRKLLYEVSGKPIILWTAERIRRVAPEYPLFFAVGDEELAEVLRGAGFEAVLTDPDLPSGTDRLAAANATIGADFIINVQADEPLVEGEDIRLIRRLLADGADLSTVGTKFRREEDYRSPMRVKVVRGVDGRALYFSRAPIPHGRDESAAGFRHALWHLGLYGYTAEFLQTFGKLPPSPLEQLEKLEQLRALEHGFRIAVGTVESDGIGIDTLEDAMLFAERVRAKTS
jgi:3-deoxy-manno-octulosonate cytidylyltransferase (CMP-KDO synthetase)